MSLAWKAQRDVQRRPHVQRARRAQRGGARHGALRRGAGVSAATAPAESAPDSGRSSRPRRRARRRRLARGNAAEVAAASRSSSGKPTWRTRTRRRRRLAEKAVRRRHRRAPALFSFPARKPPHRGERVPDVRQVLRRDGIASAQGRAGASSAPRLLRRRLASTQSRPPGGVGGDVQHGARNIARDMRGEELSLAFASDKSRTSAVSIARHHCSSPFCHRGSGSCGRRDTWSFARAPRPPPLLLRVVPALQVLERGERPALVRDVRGGRLGLGQHPHGRAPRAARASPGASSG